jgi:hypothetical protein
MKTTLPAIAILACFALSHGSSVDSVTVDSVWNSDSSWHNSNGVPQQRSARDCFISFVPQGSGYVSCSLAVSLDSGKTWDSSPNLLTILDSSLNDPFQCGKKSHTRARVIGDDRTNVVFRITSSTCYADQRTSEILGVWRFTLPYNQDTTFHIVLSYDSSHGYKISFDINGIDTLGQEDGLWHAISDNAANIDTVWMAPHNCHQMNFQTQALESVDCGVNPSGIKLNISHSGTHTVWVVPLNGFVKYFPPGTIPSGIILPPGQFVKD